MADKSLQIAVILSAYDKMSAVIDASVNKAQAKLTAFQKASDNISKKSFQYGRENLATGAAAAAPLIAITKAYGDQEDALLGMKAAMMHDGGGLDTKVFNNLKNFAKSTSETLTGSTEDYLRMIAVLKENSINPAEIMGGIGDSVARLSVLFKMPPDTIAQFAARMRQDMGIMPKEMNGMMDMIARLKNAGVGKDGTEAVTEMGEAFSKAGLGASNLGVKGLQSAKDLGSLMGIFVRRGISGGTVGNNFRRIFDGLRDAEKLEKANAVARQFGISLDFYDKNHKFKGIANFAAELSKLKGLNTTQISAILKPFGGKQGLSTDFLEFLGKEGTASFNEMNKKLADQATLNQKVTVMLGGLNKQMEIAKTTALNAAAAIGETYAPELKKLAQNANELFTNTTNWVNTHKELVGMIAKGLAYFAAFKIITGSLAFVFGGVVKVFSTFISIGSGALKVFQAVRFGLFALRYTLVTSVWPALVSATTAVWSFTAALLANPITWVVIALAALALGFYVAYQKSETFRAAISGIIAVGKLLLDVFIGVGKVIVGALTFDPSMMISGAKQAALAVNSIANGGISKTFNKAYDQSIAQSKVEAVQKKTAESNAKVESDKKKTAEAKVDADMVAPNAVSGGGTVINFSPAITLSGSATATDAKTVSEAIKTEFNKLMRDYEAKKMRVSY